MAGLDKVRGLLADGVEFRRAHTAKLPRTLDAWRVPDKLQDEDVHWKQLSETSLRTLGYCLWTKADWGWLQQSTDGAAVSPNGYLLVTPMRGKEGPVGTIDALREVLLFVSNHRLVHAQSILTRA